MAKHNQTGLAGEELAVEYLEKKGWVTLVRNFRFGRAEIDVISKDGEIPVFVEVKTLSSNNFGFPEEAVDAAKRKNIALAAQGWIEENEYEGEIRFDIVAITLNGKESPQIHHITDAFFPGIE
ncbi:MAG: putative endonuclease [Sphingobacteriales bacterium]|jgi:putative endonuclease